MYILITFYSFLHWSYLNRVSSVEKTIVYTWTTPFSSTMYTADIVICWSNYFLCLEFLDLNLSLRLSRVV